MLLTCSGAASKAMSVLKPLSYRYCSGSLPDGHTGLSRNMVNTCRAVKQGRVCTRRVVLLCCCAAAVGLQ
jgi:hypothetical protein